MRRKRLLWQLAPYFFVVSLVSIVGASWFSFHALRRFHVDRTAADLLARSQLLESQFAAVGASLERPAVDRLCKQVGARARTRITVILPSGEVVGDSEEDPSTMENHAGRPEFREALAGRTGVSRRYSSTLRRNMMYAAVPLDHEGRTVGAVRTALPVFSIERPFQSLRHELVVTVFFLLLLTAVGSLALSRWLSRPLEDMKTAAQRFAAGDLSHRMPVPASEEIGGLAEVLNQLAEQLGEKIGAMERRRNEQAAMFASMVEGVLAVDENGRVININQAAAAFLDLRPVEAVGRSLEEVVRNADLQKLVDRAMASGQPTEGDIVLYDGQERNIQAHGTTLRNGRGQHMGVLVVLNDVTRLRRLENLRRDFVANVSHELKTPITSIKGFVETLHDGAIDSPEESRRFLGIMAKQADRLNAIIEDLLNLSRIEQDAEGGHIFLEETLLREVLVSAIQFCQVKAEAKHIGVELKCDEGLTACLNPALFEQAVVNLIDNAIKYSEAGSAVRVEAAASDGEVVVSVRDNGAGIEPEHLPRLFERFYRVDKARSRQLGGTGLGLAIVKHIVQAHQGRVTVESTPGQGSVFAIRLPLPRA